jgi:crotonobetainyl-CoA:carnitine CoA-transferase CaiB-like acyl-CoA transferase
MTTQAHPGPLTGVKVLEFSEIIAAPFGGMAVRYGRRRDQVESPIGDLAGVSAARHA